MSSRTKDLLAKWYIVAPLLVTTIFLGYLLWMYSTWLNVPDTFSYYRLAEYYASFQFDKAINGYWSPLLSWLLVPAIWLHVDPTVWFRGIHVGIVLGGMLWIGWRYAHDTQGQLRIAVHTWCFALIYTAIGLMLSYWAADILTPDFIAGAIAAMVLYTGKRFVGAPTKRRGAILGVFCTLLFFAKSIGFFVSIAVLLSVVLTLWRTKRGWVRHGAALGVAVGIFVGFSVVWSSLVFLKYGSFSLTTTTKTNFSLIGPEARMSHPIDYTNTVLALPYSDSLTAWDDPTYIPPKAWVLGDNMAYYGLHVLRTFSETIFLLFFTVPVAWLGLWYVGREGGGGYMLFMILCIVGTLVVCYGLLFVEQRYLLIALVPLVVLAGLWSTNRWRHSHSYMIAVGLALLTIGIVLYTTFAQQSSTQYMRSFHATIGQMQRDIPPGSRTAVQSLDFMMHCYYLRLHCPALNYKLTDSKQANEPLVANLKEENITHYITRTPVVSDSVLLIRRYILPATSRCIVRWKLHWCGGVTVYLYKMKGIADD